MGQTQSGQLQLIQGLGVYIQPSKETFTVGEFLQGSLYLKAQKPTEIDSIKIKFQCQQSTGFVKISGQQSTMYSVNGSPYEHSFELESFKNTQKFEGNHVFPFKLLLPSELSGSIFLTPENYLKYILSAEVKISSSTSTIKSNDFIVHLTQPFRSQVQSTNESITNYPQCCDCCQSYGTVYTKLSCDKNLIKAGQDIKIEAQIDGSHARVPIRSWSVDLVMHVFKGSPEGQKEYEQKTRYQIGSFGRIKNGEKKSVKITKTIPTSFSQQSTSYGTILGVYYSLDISSQMGLFSRGANISVPIFYITPNPQIQKNIKVKTSSFSTPKTHPIYTYTKMKPYIYKPTQGMPLLNRKNFNPEGNLFTMNKSYVASDGGQDHVYQIKKTTIINDRKRERGQNETGKKDHADPDVHKGNIGNDKSLRERKYMDEENQNDYGQFKDFRSDDKGFWGDIIDAILKK